MTDDRDAGAPKQDTEPREEENPYAPPTLPKKTKRKKRKGRVATSEEDERIDAFQRLEQSVGTLFAYQIVTLGFYFIYWAFSRRRDLDLALGRSTQPALLVVALALSGLPAVIPETGLLGLGAGVLNLVYAFNLRSHLLRAQAELGVEPACSAAGVFFFPAIWLQMGINHVAKAYSRREARN